MRCLLKIDYWVPPKPPESGSREERPRKQTAQVILRLWQVEEHCPQTSYLSVPLLDRRE